jgi:hypothetical protein
MSVESPKAQISGGKAANISQRVENNAFHLTWIGFSEDDGINRRRRRYLAAEPQALCQRVEDNAFHLVGARKVDRLVRKTMSVHSSKAQIPGDKAANISQRVEDNAFHLVGAS